jgi:ATP-dependent exoDNAse (exonuclease V) alpha subunit
MEMSYGVITGPAGSGKTHLVRETVKDNPSWGLVCATTGVAARVLGDDVPTLNAAVGFFDLASLKRASDDGTLLRNVKRLKKDYDRIVIDEASMLDAETLTLLTDACFKAGLGVILVGDWMQLPPIANVNQKSNWAFQSSRWSLFNENIIRLTTQYRQKNKTFLKGLNALRVGDGATALPLLKKAGVKMSSIPSGPEAPFNGLSIVATNGTKQAIDSKNYDLIDADEDIYPAIPWGNQSPEWKDVPGYVAVKDGMRCMVLSNRYRNGVLYYANGETGVVTGHDSNGVWVRRDDGSEIFVEPVVVDDAHRRIHVGDCRSVEVTKKASGGIKYLPLTKSWALTVHKSQGLTLLSPTRVKLWADQFWRSPAMVYVACSRVKTPGLLDIAGGDFVLGENTVLEDKCVAATECRVVNGDAV